MRAFALLGLVLSVWTVPSGCKAPTDEETIRTLVRRSLEGVDDKRVRQVVAPLADDFRGPGGMRAREARLAVLGHLRGQGWLRTFETALDVTVDGAEAHVDLEVMVARGARVDSVTDLLPTNGTKLDFDLELEKRGGTWEVVEGAYARLPW